MQNDDGRMKGVLKFLKRFFFGVTARIRLALQKGKIMWIPPLVVALMLFESVVFDGLYFFIFQRGAFKILEISTFDVWVHGEGYPRKITPVPSILCCASFAYLSWQAYRQGKQEWTWILGLTAFVYNPIVPIYFHKTGYWEMVNAVALAIAVATLFTLRGTAVDSVGK